MSGKPQFDEAAVIAAAIEVFWRNGYAAAAVSDLTEATGLSRSSLYQRFHDKDGLFQEALEASVLAGTVQHVPGVFRVQPVLVRVEAALHHFVCRSGDLCRGRRVPVAE